MSNTSKLGWRLEEIAEALGVSRQFVAREEKLGNLKAKRVAGAVIVLTRDLEDWLEGPDGTRDPYCGADRRLTEFQSEMEERFQAIENRFQTLENKIDLVHTAILDVRSTLRLLEESRPWILPAKN